VSRFLFRLQRVLELRAQHEQAVATSLARALDRADETREAHEMLAQIRKAGAEQLSAAHSANVTVGQLQNIGYVLEQLDQHVTMAADSADAARTGVSDAEQELTVAHQARRMLDRLRERQLGEWTQAQSQDDRQRMDTFALSRFISQNPQLTNEK
jgi:flagellar FliJ protein